MLSQLIDQDPAWETFLGGIPQGLFNFGGGGVAGYGTLCGTPNGMAAVMRLVLGTAGNAPTQALYAWYESALLPSNTAYELYRAGGWTPTAGWGSPVPVPLNNAPKSRANSVLCHASDTNWKAIAGSWAAANPTANTPKDRCSKLAFDVVYKGCELINAVLDGSTVTPEFATSVGYCTGGCHDGSGPGAAANGKMDCFGCHTQRSGDNHGA